MGKEMKGIKKEGKGEVSKKWEWEEKGK